jgi:hypothetical protein
VQCNAYTMKWSSRGVWVVEGDAREGRDIRTGKKVRDKELCAMQCIHNEMVQPWSLGSRR